jgi:glycosyltransferase involved in cell wall biosynthesis
MFDPIWLAGTQYLYNLLFAIKANDLPIAPVLRVTADTPPSYYNALNGLFERVIVHPYVMPQWGNKLFQHLTRKLISLLSNEDAMLQRHHVDAQFVLLDPGKVSRIPAISWIPDFQYLHYPEYFSKEELDFRAKIYPDSARKAKLVVLSSQQVFNDFKDVVPGLAHKARILRFVAQVNPEVYEPDPQEISRHYCLPERFFFLPNQFWQHKNHLLVLKALALVRMNFPDITVVCSGGIYDHRNPGFFDEILQEIARQGIQTNIRILGKLPRNHFWQLTRQSLAVIQPSLFEGWSTSVEEVKSLGKSIILSDIPVHREQHPPAAHYFNPNDPAELASVMQNLYEAKTPGPEFELENQSRAALPERTRIFAATFYEIVRDVLEK